MFFKSGNITFEILTTLLLERGKISWKSISRTHNVLSVRTRGCAEFVTDNNVIPVNPGDILLIPPESQYLQKSEGEKLYVVHFVSDLPLPSEIRKFTPANPEYFILKFEELHSIWTKKHPGYEYECKAIMYKILAGIEREYAEGKTPLSSDRIAEAVDYIHTHFTDYTLTVEKLAKLCGMSDTYFRKLFVNRFSVTPLKYINRLRLNYAKELIRSSYYTIEEIAEKCGFNNINYFSLFVKKETGKSPTELKCTVNYINSMQK